MLAHVIASGHARLVNVHAWLLSLKDILYLKGPVTHGKGVSVYPHRSLGIVNELAGETTRQLRAPFACFRYSPFPSSGVMNVTTACPALTYNIFWTT